MGNIIGRSSGLLLEEVQSEALKEGSRAHPHRGHEGQRQR